MNIFFRFEAPENDGNKPKVIKMKETKPHRQNKKQKKQRFLLNIQKMTA